MPEKTIRSAVLNEYEASMTRLMEKLIAQLAEIDDSLMTIVERMDIAREEEKKEKEDKTRS